MLIADRDAFETAALQLWHVSSWLKNEDGSLVQPPRNNTVELYRSAVRCALAMLHNAPIKLSEPTTQGITDE